MADEHVSIPVPPIMNMKIEDIIKERLINCGKLVAAARATFNSIENSPYQKTGLYLMIDLDRELQSLFDWANNYDWPAKLKLETLESIAKEDGEPE